LRQSAISFQSKRLNLEGIISFPDDLKGNVPAVAVCHSHPMLGGAFSDPVVVEICRAANDLGMATLRFNFRGVGESQGEFTNGSEEHHDAKTALDVLRKWPGVDRKQVALAGYSLGAAVVLESLKEFKHARALAFVAPTVKSVQNDRFKRDKRPRLVVAGGNDRVAPSLEIQRALDEARQPLRFAEVANADHSMRGHETEIARIVADFISESLT
jgi:hypothetical protein